LARKKKKSIGNKRKRSSSKRKTRLPSWNEVRAGLIQQTKLKLLLILGRIYLSKATPRSVKLNIITIAKIGTKMTIKRTIKRRKSAGRILVLSKRKSQVKRKGRTAKQRAATRKLIAFNRRRR